MRIFTFLLVVLGLSLTACEARDTQPKANTETPKAAAWKLLGSESRLEFISVKKGTVIETHSFTDLSGMVLPDGSAVILVKLDSVETNIDIRNERMKKYLFETDKLQSIMLKTQINTESLAKLPLGGRTEIDIPVTISMHGKTGTLDVPVAITRLSDHKVVVDSRTPIMLDGDAYGYGPGIDKLQELAKLSVIAHDIPVMFSLVFEQE